MPLEIRTELKPEHLSRKLEEFWHLSAEKLQLIIQNFDPASGSPVFTAEGRYTTRGWTEWTQGFLFGSAILQFDASGEQEFLKYGRDQTVGIMAPHLTHMGVHDHGFNNVSTYGNLLRLMNEGKLPENYWERNFLELALKVSGAVQASRWTKTAEGRGFIYSFNGPHSLFADTIRSLRALAISHDLGYYLMGENDERISLLSRLINHAWTTSRYSVYYGDGRDAYDERGRVAHESIFNTNDGRYRCPNSQQGYSPFTTWTRGLAWTITGFAEQLEYIASLEDSELEPYGGKAEVLSWMERAAGVSADYYLMHTPPDGIPYWDTGAPGLSRIPDHLQKSADPLNSMEPVDSSAAAIASQGLMRFGSYLLEHGDNRGQIYFQAGLTVVSRLLEQPYLSTDPSHQGLLLHSVYHRPNNWDYTPHGSSVPHGESSMWGDYHIREAALMVSRLAAGTAPPVFWRHKEHP